MLVLEKSGNGVPLVFLHAFPLSRKMWDGSRPIFAKNFQFISVDFPGFGESPLKTDATAMDDVALALGEALDKAGIREKIVLAGLSMGGYAAFRFLAKFPERLRSLILISTKATPDTDAARQKRAENVIIVERQGLKVFAERSVPSLIGKTTQLNNPDLMRRVTDWIATANPKGVCAALRGMALRPDSSPLLNKIMVPTFVLSGEEDTIIPSTEMAQMAGQIKGADFQSIPGCGHLLSLEKPSSFKTPFSLS